MDRKIGFRRIYHKWCKQVPLDPRLSGVAKERLADRSIGHAYLESAGEGIDISESKVYKMQRLAPGGWNECWLLLVSKVTGSAW
jgi:hypothetical protein